MDPDPHLAGAWFGDGQVDDVQDVRAAEFGQADCLHGILPEVGTRSGLPAFGEAGSRWRISRGKRG
jgi:hypothetical protein